MAGELLGLVAADSLQSMLAYLIFRGVRAYGDRASLLNNKLDGQLILFEEEKQTKF